MPTEIKWICDRCGDYCLLMADRQDWLMFESDYTELLFCSKCKQDLYNWIDEGKKRD